MRQATAAISTITSLLLAGVAHAQIPGIPAAPPAAAAASPAAAAAAANPAAAAAAPPGNIWSFFMKTPEQKAQCKSHFCNSSIGQFINNLLLPAGAMTGGLIGPLCPNPATDPNPDDLKKSSTSAQGAAAKIKAEEAQAKAKIEAIEYLASVDCRYYPEAEAGMISGLRSEKNECVRLAAAKALASGCCCSAKVIKALTMTVNCSNKDGFPAEASELVRIFAFVALERCLKKCVEAEEETPPEQPPAVKQALYEALKPIGSTINLDREILLAAYFAPNSTETSEKIFLSARQTIAKGMKISQTTLSRMTHPKNVYDGLLPNGLSWPTKSEVVTAAASEPVVQTPEPMPATVEPPVKPAEALATRPTVAVPPTMSLYREPRPTKIPDTLSQRVIMQPTPPPLPSNIPPRSVRSQTGRKNLLNIFQDASQR